MSTSSSARWTAVGARFADPDQVELALAAQILEGAQLLGEQVARGFERVDQAQVDEIHPLDPQRAQVVLDAGAQLGGKLRRAATRPDRHGGRRPW